MHPSQGKTLCWYIPCLIAPTHKQCRLHRTFTEQDLMQPTQQWKHLDEHSSKRIEQVVTTSVVIMKNEGHPANSKCTNHRLQHSAYVQRTLGSLQLIVLRYRTRNLSQRSLFPIHPKGFIPPFSLIIVPSRSALQYGGSVLVIWLFKEEPLFQTV